MTAAYAYHQRNKALPLSPDYFTPLTLVKATKLTSTIREFTFHSDASSPHVLNPLIPSAYWVKHDGIQVARPYTPIKVTSKDGKDELTFAIRVYPDGTMSRWLWTKTSGDVVEWRGPIPSADWTFDPKRDTSLLLVRASLFMMVRVDDDIRCRLPEELGLLQCGKSFKMP